MVGAVTHVGDSAFADCVDLEVMQFPDTLIEIGDGAFTGCRRLSRVLLGENIQKIGARAFHRCGSLREIEIAGSGLVIGQEAFRDCSALCRILFGAGLKRVESGALAGCELLRRAFFEGDAPELGESVFDVPGPTSFYYLPAMSGWTSTFGGLPTVPWDRSSLALSCHPKTPHLVLFVQHEIFPLYFNTLDLNKKMPWAG